MAITENSLFFAAFYVLGFVGLFAITLLPLRIGLAVRRAVYLRRGSVIGKIAFYFVVAGSLIAFVFASAQVVGVFRCLTGLHCSADRAGGWLFLISIGVCYIAFEALSAFVFTVARRLMRVTT